MWQMHEYSKLIEILLDVMKNDALISLQQDSLSTLLLIATKFAPKHQNIIGDLNTTEKILEIIILIYDRGPLSLLKLQNLNVIIINLISYEISLI